MSASARWLRWGQRLLLTLGSLSLPATAQELAQASGADCRTMGPRVVLGICAITLIGTFVGLLAVRQRLGREGWSLANALSEPTRLTIPIDPRWSQSQGDKEAETSLPGGVSLVGTGTAGKEGAPVGLTILEASSSRLIALVGMVVILLMYLGFGVFALYSFGLTCQMPASTASVTSFLYAGLTLFAPYVANKVSGILKPVLGNQPPPPPETAGTRLPAPGRGGYGLMAPGGMPLSGPAPASAGRGEGGSLEPQGEAGARPAIAPPHPPAGPQSPPSTSRPGAAPAAARPPKSPGPAPSHPGGQASGAPGLATAAAVDPYAPAVALIARFEGFVDHAYPDPASGAEPWTIGYGFTSLDGRPVQPGDTLSEAEAQRQLDRGVASCAAHLAGTIPYWASMASDQRCALISFAWNLGEDFYGSAGFDTISARLRDHAWDEVPAALALYCDPGSAVTAGLLRRRQAEGDLWCQGMASPAAVKPPPRSGSASTAGAPASDRTPPSRPPSAAKASGAATSGAVTGALNAPQGASLTSGSATTLSGSLKPSHPNPLPVPWFDQLAMDDGQGWRDCFSASSAMLAAFWGKEPNEDDYNSLRQCYGDSTSAEAQLAALRHLGLQADFRTDGTLQTLRDEIDAGRPVAVGWLHHGPPADPSGGGHWTVVIGYDDTGVIMNDPYGSCDLIHGGYPANHNGARQHYSYANWEPRWRPQGSGGWYLSCRP